MSRISMLSWLQVVAGQFRRSPKNRRPAFGHRPALPHLEVLEDR